MGKVKAALDIGEEIMKTDCISREIQERPGYPLFAAADNKFVREIEAGEREVPHGGSTAYTNAVIRFIQESAEAAIPDWKRTTTGDFERSFDGTHLPKFRQEEMADKAQWLLDQLAIEYIREGNGFIMSAEENAKVREEGKGLRVCMAGRLPL